MKTNYVERNLFGGFPRLLWAAISLVLLLSIILVSQATNASAENLRPQYTADDTIVTCNPQNASGLTTSPLVVEIYVANVTDLYGADVRMAFDTNLAQVIDAEPGSPATVEIEPLDSFLSPDFVVRKIADNTDGTIWYAATQINPSPPVSGSGSLARITFQPLMAGTFEFPVTFFQLANGDGFEIPAIAENCTVTFVEPDADFSMFIPVIFNGS